VNRNGWTTARPTIYCSASVLPALGQAGWRGDVWVADYINQAPTQPYPVPAGMTCVAWQWTDQGGGGAYDLSVVFDPTWPQAAPAPKGKKVPGMIVIRNATTGACCTLDAGQVHFIAQGADLNAFGAAGVPVVTITAELYAELGGLAGPAYR